MNTSETREYNKRYYKKYRAKILARANQRTTGSNYQDYYNTNKIRIKAAIRRYKEKNKSKVNGWNAARRIGCKMLLSKVEKQMISILYIVSTNITKNTNVVMHVDHIVPISLGGLHHPINLQVIPAVDNFKKSDNRGVISYELHMFHMIYSKNYRNSLEV